MRKLSPERRQAYVRLQKERERHRVQRLDGGKRSRSSYNRLVAEYHSRLPLDAPRRNRIALVVPSELSLKDNYEETVAFIDALRLHALQEFRPVDLFFENVVYLEPAALTVLTAEIHRCRNLRRIGGKPAVSGYYPTDPAIYRQLREIGFFRLLDIADRAPAETRSGDGAERLVLPFLTDAYVTSDRSAQFIDLLADAIEGAAPMDEQSKRYLQGAIVEAMKNSAEHAYKLKPRYQALGHRWWLTGVFDRTANEVSIILFDQGVGIPATLEPDLLDIIESLTRAQGLQPRDSLMIEVATRPGQTSTGQSGRGLGFKTMRKFVDACDDGDLIVYSNHGNYLYARSGTARGDGSLSLGGTLIQWRFRHSGPIMVTAP